MYYLYCFTQIHKICVGIYNDSDDATLDYKSKVHTNNTLMEYWHLVPVPKTTLLLIKLLYKKYEFSARVGTIVDR